MLTLNLQNYLEKTHVLVEIETETTLRTNPW